MSTRPGWPWWAVLPQGFVAYIGTGAVMGVDQILQFFHRAAPVGTTPVDAGEDDNGALGFVLLPILLGFLVVFVVTALLVPPALVVGVAMTVGSPIRFAPGIRRWWVANNEIAWLLWIGGFVLAIGVMLASLAEPRTQNAFTYIPAPLFLLGCLLLAFGLAHATLPVRWRSRRLSPS